MIVPRDLHRHTTYMKMALDLADLSTCTRARYGAVVVKFKRIIGTGYNGSKDGEPHCDEVGCLTEPTGDCYCGSRPEQLPHTHCTRTIHAEENALRNCLIHPRGSILYVTGDPCLHCQIAAREDAIEQIITPTTLGDMYEQAGVPRWSDPRVIVRRGR